MRQDSLVQHVRVGDDDVAARAHGLSRIARRVAVERERSHAKVGCLVDLEQLAHLVLRESLRREQIQRLRLFAHRCLQHRQVVAERLARRGRRDDNDVLAATDGIPGCALMAVKLLDPARTQRDDQSWIKIGGEGRVTRRLRRDAELAGDPIGVPALEARDDVADVGALGEPGQRLRPAALHVVGVVARRYQRRHARTIDFNQRCFERRYCTIHCHHCLTTSGSVRPSRR